MRHLKKTCKVSTFTRLKATGSNSRLLLRVGKFDRLFERVSLISHFFLVTCSRTAKVLAEKRLLIVNDCFESETRYKGEYI